MKVAIISDIHGNYPALIKVIEDAKKYSVDKFVFIGDYIFDLPFSNDVIKTISNLKDAHIIAGNKETYVTKLGTENKSNWVFNQMAAVYQTYWELEKDVIDFLNGLQEECFITLDSGKVMLASHFFKGLTQQSKSDCDSLKFHKKMLSQPFSHKEYLAEYEYMINQEDFKKAIDKTNADIVLFGHNHLQGYGYYGEKLVINPGSCGLPLDFNNTASYSILEETQNKFNVIERRVPYDIEATIAITKQSILYEKAPIWSELVFLAMRTARDYFGIIFSIANEIASIKGESGQFYTNKTWEEAYKTLIDEYDLK